MINFQQLKNSFGYAIEGIGHALRYNQNLRIHFGAAIVVIFLSVFFHVNSFEKGILGIMILLVISAEMVNSAIEEMVDYVITEHKKEAKIAKDVSAGMVLLTAFGSIIVGILVFAPYIWKYFFK